MGVLLQGFYKKQPGVSVPSPADGDASVPFWWDRLASLANELRKVGFTAVWLPPVLKTSVRDAGPNADGYGPFDDYDIGSRHQNSPKGETWIAIILISAGVYVVSGGPLPGRASIISRRRLTKHWSNRR
jgi:hypothetical protein